MKQLRVTLYKDEDFIKGYAYREPPYEITERGIWDKIYETMGQYSNYRYLKHFVVEESFIENQNLQPHKVNIPDVPYQVIPRGTATFVLILFVEER